MKKSLLALSTAIVLGAVPTLAQADLAFNAGVFSDYRYRGISQTRLKPAVQAGVDYSLGGFYVGAWASSIKWIKDFGGDANVEVDLYGGYKGDIIKDSLSYDVGVLRYQYPSNKLKPSANTTELYGALTYGPATLKYSQALTNTFGALDSKNTYYLDLSATFDVGGISVVPHVGYQKYKGPAAADATYTDYSLTVSKDFSGLVLSLAAVDTNAKKAFYASPANGKNLGKAGVVVGVKYNF